MTQLKLTSPKWCLPASPQALQVLIELLIKRARQEYTHDDAVRFYLNVYEHGAKRRQGRKLVGFEPHDKFILDCLQEAIRLRDKGVVFDGRV